MTGAVLTLTGATPAAPQVLDDFWTRLPYNTVMSEGDRPRVRDHLFVVRMWRDDDDRLGRWRAQVTHVTSRERHYFTNYGELCEFIDRCREPTVV